MDTPPTDTPMYERAAKLAERGLGAREVAAELGVPRKNASQYLCYARRNGALGPVQTRKDTGGGDTWRYLNNKGAAPPQGRLRTSLDHLDRDEVIQLLDMMTRADATLAHLVGRILKEYLNASQKAR